jgi:lipopolysaccharide export system permease protein
MAPKLLDRYIFRQLLDYFLMGIVVFTLVAFFSDTLLKFIREIQKYGIPLTTLLTMVGLQLPRSIALVMPASAFLAVLMVFNQLNNQFEIVALRMNGISLWRIMAPALLLGVMCSGLAYWLSDYVVPWCNQRTDQMKRMAISQTTLPANGNSFTYNTFDENHNLTQMIYVSNYHGQRLEDTTILDLSKNKTMQIYQARSGTLDSYEGWSLENVNHYTIIRQQDAATDEQKFSSGHLGSLKLGDLIKNTRKDEKLAEIEKERKDGTWISSEQQNFAQMLAAIKTREAQKDKVPRGNYLQLWAKLTWPLSCLVIILSAVPLSITPPRQGSNRGFVYAIIVLFLFYMLHNTFQNIGKTSSFDLISTMPLPAYLTLLAWMPVTIMTVIGCVLIQRKTKVL